MYCDIPEINWLYQFAPGAILCNLKDWTHRCISLSECSDKTVKILHLTGKSHQGIQMLNFKFLKFMINYTMGRIGLVLSFFLITWKHKFSFFYSPHLLFFYSLHLFFSLSFPHHKFSLCFKLVKNTYKCHHYIKRYLK